MSEGPRVHAGWRMREERRDQFVAALLGAAFFAGMAGCGGTVEPPPPPLPVSDLFEGDPAGVGMSKERLERVAEMAQGYVDEGKLAGVVNLVARGGKIVHFRAVGQRGAEDDRPVTKDSLFRIFSMTKPITAVAAMMLYEEGKFRLSDPVADIVPELAELNVLVDGELVPAKNTMTMRHLLTHTCGLSYGFNPRDPVDQRYREAQLFAAADLDEFAKRLGELPLAFEPGERWHYSVAVDVTGLVVQRLSGMSFDEFLRQRIFEPLDMKDTFFNVPEDKMHRFLPNHAWNRQEEKLTQLQVEEDDEDAFARYRNATLFSGGGGLVSTALDYARFAEMVRRGGELDGARLLSPKTVSFMTANHLPAAIEGGGSGEDPTGASASRFGFGLGWGINTDVVASGVVGSVGEYSWGGAAGTVFWVDPVEEMVVVGMIQLMGSPWNLRHDLRVASYQAIVGPAGVE